MSKYLRVNGLNPDYSDVYYELNNSALLDLLHEAFQHGKDGGDIRDMGVSVVELTPTEYKKLEEL